MPMSSFQRLFLRLFLLPLRLLRRTLFPCKRFFDMEAIRAVCARNDLGVPNSVETLTNSVLVLIDNAGRFARAYAAVEDLTAAVDAKFATIVNLESKLTAQPAKLASRSDAMRAEDQSNRVGLEAKMTSGYCPCGLGLSSR